MKGMHKSLNLMLSLGLIGAFVMTLLAPKAITLLFTPPVSFGTNCEPAAVWSMDRLVGTQMGGLLLGMIGGLVLSIAIARRNRSKAAEAGLQSGVLADAK